MKSSDCDGRPSAIKSSLCPLAPCAPSPERNAGIMSKRRIRGGSAVSGARRGQRGRACVCTQAHSRHADKCAPSSSADPARPTETEMQACCPLESTIGLPVRGDVSTTCSMCETRDTHTGRRVSLHIRAHAQAPEHLRARSGAQAPDKNRDLRKGTRAGITVVSRSELAVLPVDTTLCGDLYGCMGKDEPWRRCSSSSSRPHRQSCRRAWTYCMVVARHVLHSTHSNSSF